MKKLCLVICLFAIVAARPGAAEEYSLGPDSQRQLGVPEGKVTHYTWTSKIFPGTVRDYWVYVPAQYVSDKPACVMVFQDGEGFMKEDGRARVPIVFDNLIAKHEMPVTIGVFINPGVLKALSPDQQDRFNRSFEYDGLGDRYARFLLEEILPEVAKHYNLSTNPDDRAISGLSSGGICAFTAAWNRPDAFHRVLSFIGSFTNLRGGDIYPSLIRKTEPKPLRVLLQDGGNDLNIYAGSWWLANQSFASALGWAGYDVKFVTGDKDHDMIQGGAILPDALRWLWHDYPKPIIKPAPNHSGDKRTDILDPGSDWELASLGEKATSGLAIDAKGEVYFGDGATHRIKRISGNGTIYDFKDGVGTLNGMMFGPDGTLYACAPETNSIEAFAVKRPASYTVTAARGCRNLAVISNDQIFFTDADGVIWDVEPHMTRELAHIVGQPQGILLSPDHSLLFVSNKTWRWIWSIQLLPDGSSASGSPFFRLEIPDESSESGGAGMTVDSLGYLYVATNLGIQVCDQPGRVVAIINPPSTEPLSGIVFGGADLQDLYVVAGGKIYRRHMLRKGVLPWLPQKPPVPQL